MNVQIQTQPLTDGGDGLPFFLFRTAGKFNVFKQESRARQLLRSLWLPEWTHGAKAGRDLPVEFGSRRPTPTLGPGQIRGKKKIF